MRFAALAVALLFPLAALAGETGVNTGATGGSLTTMWDPGTAVTVLPNVQTVAGKAKRVKNRKAISLQFQGSAGACCVTFDPVAPSTTTSGCAHGIKLSPDFPTLSRNFAGTFPVNVACTQQMSAAAGTGVAVDQAW